MTQRDARLAEAALVRRVRDRIDRDYALDLDVATLARDVAMSAGHLSRRFRVLYNESPYHYLATRRIERAMALLRRGDLSVSEVCWCVGYDSVGTFSRRFRQLVGVSPSQFQRGHGPATLALPSCVVRCVARPVRNGQVHVAAVDLA